MVRGEYCPSERAVARSVNLHLGSSRNRSHALEAKGASLFDANASRGVNGIEAQFPALRLLDLERLLCIRD